MWFEACAPYDCMYVHNTNMAQMEGQKRSRGNSSSYLIKKESTPHIVKM